MAISTHTSRVGCDVLFALLKFVWQISTHTSRVGCDARNAAIEFSVSKFLLTHPVWDVTSMMSLVLFALLISTHTSRVGCDWHPVSHFETG